MSDGDQTTVKEAKAASVQGQAAHDTLDIAGVRGSARVTLPRITIKYCTQCKWMLRAAYVCVKF